MGGRTWLSIQALPVFPSVASGEELSQSSTFSICKMGTGLCLSFQAAARVCRRSLALPGEKPRKSTQRSPCSCSLLLPGDRRHPQTRLGQFLCCCVQRLKAKPENETKTPAGCSVPALSTGLVEI